MTVGVRIINFSQYNETQRGVGRGKAISNGTFVRGRENYTVEISGGCSPGLMKHYFKLEDIYSVCTIDMKICIAFCCKSFDLSINLSVRLL